MSINKRFVSIAALTLMIGLPSSFAWGQQPGVTNQAKSAAASSVSSRIQGQMQQRAQAQVQAQQAQAQQAQAQQVQAQAQQAQAQTQLKIQQQAEAQVQSRLKADVTRAAQLAQKAVAESQAQNSAKKLSDSQRQFSVTRPPAMQAGANSKNQLQSGASSLPFDNLVDLFRFKSSHDSLDGSNDSMAGPNDSMAGHRGFPAGPTQTLADTKLPMSDTKIPQSDNTRSLANTRIIRIPATDPKESLADPKESLADPNNTLADTKLSLTDMKRKRAGMKLPNGITETDVRLYDNIFGQYNPFRADVSTPSVAVTTLSPANPLESDNLTQSHGSNNGQYSNLVEAAQAKANGGSQTDLGDRIAAAITQRRAEISWMRDQAIENADQQKLQAADKMEMTLNTFVEAQAEAQAASVRAAANTNSSGPLRK